MRLLDSLATRDQAVEGRQRHHTTRLQEAISPTARRSVTRARGFTLLELMMAMVAGMLVSIAAFSFSKQSTRFFAQEARVAATQMSVLSGFQRLQADVSRASFLSLADLTRAQALHKLCAPNYSSWTPSLRNLAGVRVMVGGSSTAQTLPDGKKPDLIRVSGSLSTVEYFTTNSIEPSGSGSRITLEGNKGSMVRLGFLPGADITSVFRPGRVVRVENGTTYSYAVIAAASYPSGSSPVIITKNALPQQSQATPCGFQLGQGKQLAVVNVVEYGIASLRNISVYQRTIYSTAGTALGDSTRTELVRREVLLNNGEPPAFDQDPGAEVVAEYAVDLRAGLWISGTNPHVPHTFLEPSSPAITQLMQTTSGFTTQYPTGPSAVRSVQLRLAVRSREADRRSATDNELPDAGFFHRVPLSSNSPYWARVRTLTAEVALMNNANESSDPR